MQLSDFDYVLPGERIAQTPIEPRDSARLLVAGNPVRHLHVSDLADLLLPGDLLVVNETRVIPARLKLRRATGGAAEVLLLEATNGARTEWEALVRPGKKLKPGRTIKVGSSTGTVIETNDKGERLIRWDNPPDLDKVGQLALPHYMEREPEKADRERYQTVYAKEDGAIAAPTAGLHFTPELFDRLDARGVNRATVELVVGLDTFQPISTDNPLDHPMHTERYRVPPETMQQCIDTHAAGSRVVAVGTTAVRALESAAKLGELSGRTNIFIHEGFDWQVVDVLLTNFHLPKTTLLMMIDAFAGPGWRELYAEAIQREYRFLSFGDAMLLERSSR